ncbi:hypothetical protein [Agromyces mediolanus]|uniref:hypothetical protein n=1 Tax=Agromyces mediolanus TaxID=41986 RepID=UPI001E30AB9C|nr:hypothetical protein [Agromyces mediolanus]MCD1570564.1 hypothetical protein [Agromyces mediolanus]
MICVMFDVASLIGAVAGARGESGAGGREALAQALSAGLVATGAVLVVALVVLRRSRQEVASLI